MLWFLCHADQDVMASDPVNLPTIMFALVLLKKLPAVTMHSGSAFWQPSLVPQCGRLPKPAIKFPQTLHTFKMQSAQRRELWSPILLQVKTVKHSSLVSAAGHKAKTILEQRGRNSSSYKRRLLLKCLADRALWGQTMQQLTMAAVVEDDKNSIIETSPEEGSYRPQGPVLCYIGTSCKEANVQRCSDNQCADSQI